MKHLDNRVRYTKTVLQQALLQLLQRKHIDKISIKELCDTAKVNRGTFYLHYATPNELLMEIEQQFIDENMRFFTPYLNSSRDTEHLAGVFTSIINNKELCRILMGKNGNPRFLQHLQERMRGYILDGWCKEFPGYDRRDLDYVYDFVFTGSMRLILNWLEDDRGMSTAELAGRLDLLGHHCHLAIAQFPQA